MRTTLMIYVDFQALTSSGRLDRRPNRYALGSFLKDKLAYSDVGNNNSADDMKNVDLTRIHYLSGPFEVETAEPGDVLLVEIMDVQPHQKHPWGFVGLHLL